MDIEDVFLIHGISDKKCSMCGDLGDILTISIIGSYPEGEVDGN